MPIDLTGKPIAITGASSGIGAATAIACAAAGMPVALGARRLDKLRSVADRITASGGRAIVVPVDVCNPADCERLVNETVRAFGSIYAVFANAGYGLEAPTHELPDAELRAIFECNLFGTLNTVRPAIPRMIRAGEASRAGRGDVAGHVLICSSCLAKMTVPYYGVYSATKAAQNHLGRSMNHELRRLGVRVSTIHPVGTKTEFFDTVKSLNKGARLVDHTPDRFMQSPERVARAIVRCLRRPRAEVWTSGLVRLGMAVCNALPGVEDFFLRKMLDQRLANAAKAEAARAGRSAGSVPG